MQKSPLKKKSKLNSSKIRKQCVEIAKLIIKHNANYTCEKCGRTQLQVQQQGAHIFPEGRYSSMSADTDNILCLCAGCHMWSNDSWHENPLESSEWFKNRFPGRYEELKRRSQESKQMGKFEWSKKLSELKEQYNGLIN